MEEDERVYKPNYAQQYVNAMLRLLPQTRHAMDAYDIVSPGRDASDVAASLSLVGKGSDIAGSALDNRASRVGDSSIYLSKNQNAINSAKGFSKVAKHLKNLGTVLGKIGLAGDAAQAWEVFDPNAEPGLLDERSILPKNGIY